MSMFLPEGTQQQPSQGVAQITPANPETTQEDIALMQRVLSAASRNPNLIPADFMAYLLDFIQTARLIIPIGQVFGFSQYTAHTTPRVGSVDEATTSTSYADLATTGPTLDGLPDGKYLVFIKSVIRTAVASNLAAMSYQVNGTAASDTDSIVNKNANDITATGFSLQSLSRGSGNSLTAKYRTDNAAAAATFSGRLIVALKYANL